MQAVDFAFDKVLQTFVVFQIRIPP